MNADRTPTVIFVTHVVPYPPAAGNEVRILKLIKWLKERGYRVVLLLNTKSLAPDVRAPLEKIVHGIHCVGEDIPDVQIPKSVNRGNRFKTFFRKTADLLTVSSLLMMFEKEEIVDPEYKKKGDAVRKYLCPEKLKQMTYYYARMYRPFAVIAEYIFTAPCLDLLPEDTIKLIDTHDVFSKKKEQVLSHGVEDPLYCTPREEREYLLKCDVIIAIQDIEARLFRKLAPRRKIITVGIDYDIVGDVDNSQVRPGLVLVVGSDNPSNVHGLQEFYRNAWPLIRRAHPHAILRVAGKLGNKFQTGDASVEILGWVETLDVEYQKACVVINPTVAGTGLKIKSVEALCRAKPLVATWHSVEGISFEGAPPFVVCDDWRDFADAVNRLLDSEELRTALQRRSLSFSRQHFGPDEVYRPLTGIFPLVA